jgi:hypothetical protein
MFTFLLMLHMLAAVFVLGATTHQALGAAWPGKDKRTFFSSMRSVRGNLYINAIIVSYIIAAVLGGIVYVEYRLTVWFVLQNLDLRLHNGLFELKEHWAAIGLMLLPAYWYYWRQPQDPKHTGVRGALAGIIAFIVWYNFIVGHILNNTRGIES